jgi:hypothetical protein
MKKIIDLKKNETQRITGGGPAWRWTGKVIGTISHFIEEVCDSYSSTPEGLAVQKALRDFQ